jgi:hypothetical protein
VKGVHEALADMARLLPGVILSAGVEQRGEVLYVARAGWQPLRDLRPVLSSAHANKRPARRRRACTRMLAPPPRPMRMRHDRAPPPRGACRALRAEERINAQQCVSLIPAVKRAAMQHCVPLGATVLPALHIKGTRGMCSVYEYSGTVRGSARGGKGAAHYAALRLAANPCRVNGTDASGTSCSTPASAHAGPLQRMAGATTAVRVRILRLQVVVLMSEPGPEELLHIDTVLIDQAALPQMAVLHSRVQTLLLAITDPAAVAATAGGAAAGGRGGPARAAAPGARAGGRG